MNLAGMAQALVIIGAANTAPLIGKRLFGKVAAWPIDADLVMPDGRPLLGRSKTWRGIALALLAATAAAFALGLPPGLGALAGASAMAGDLLSSFAKRRIGQPPSSQALGLDQVPEALLGLLVLAAPLGLGAAEVVAAVVGFFVIELVMSRLLYAVGLRDEPY
jgi:CDP-2,3-bis-(O-geranylgeranyl)-sn-glycerol synthase